MGSNTGVLQLALQQLIHLKDPGRVAHGDLHPDGPLLAALQLHVADGRRRNRMDAGGPGLEGDTRPSLGHIQGVSHLQYARL